MDVNDLEILDFITWYEEKNRDKMIPYEIRTDLLLFGMIDKVFFYRLE